MATLLTFTEEAMARELASQTTGERSDAVRLSGQLAAVFEMLSDGKWWTLAELAHGAQASTQSVSARIRDLRKSRFGAHDVRRHRLEGGLWRYRMVIPNS